MQEPTRISSGKELSAAHAKALEEWLNRQVEKIVPAQTRLQANADPRHVREWCRQNHVRLERVGKTLHYNLMRKKKILSQFRFVVRAFHENDLQPPANDSITQSPVPQKS
jgi:hypothetical protein